MFVSAFSRGKFIWGRCGFYYNLVSESGILGEIKILFLFDVGFSFTFFDYGY